MNVRERLKALGKTQNWLILEMKKHDVSVITSEFSNILKLSGKSGKHYSPVCE